MRDDPSNLGRRDAIHRLALSLGGLVTFPLVASAHPIQHHLRDEAAIGQADAKAAAAEYVPEFLDPHQLATLDALAEKIVPGSTKARSSQFIDQLLAVSTAAEQRTFLQALGAFEGIAIARGAPWKSLPDPQQIELLMMASTEKAGAAGGQGASAGGHATIRDHFEHVKGWIVGAYYSSELGMRELGWTENVFFPAFPGCDHPDGHR